MVWLKESLNAKVFMITSTFLHSYLVALCNELCNKQNIHIQEHSLARRETKN